MTTNMFEQFDRDHVTPLREAWNEFVSAAHGEGGDTVAAYVNYRRLYRAADTGGTQAEMGAHMQATRAYEKEAARLVEWEATLTRYRSLIDTEQRARRNTDGLYTDEIAAINKAVNEYADSIGSSIHRSADDLSHIRTLDYTSKPSGTEFRTDLRTIPNHETLQDAITAVLAH